MFSKIFLFEIKYRLHRPAVYVYFFACLIFTFLSFALGAMPLDEKQFMNGASSLAFFVSVMSLMMMLVSSSVMGIPLYRDIEYGTKEYYLSYPITKAGYFWGRFLSSFFFVLLIDSAVLFGAYLGCLAGPHLGWESAAHYGPTHIINYLYPFLVIAVPNLFFTSSLFFGLVAITRNVKVIYSSGILLFLGYMISNFFINSSSNLNVIYLADPFAVNAVRYERGLQSVAEKNTSLIALKGLFLSNRLIWTGIGAVILAYTYLTFSFEKFFSGRRDKKTITVIPPAKKAAPFIHTSFTGNYTRKTLFTLTRIEVLNIMRDNYFWLIIAGGSIFLGMVFRHSPGNYWTPDYPRTSWLMFIFNNTFLTFVFCIIVFYTGETIHREKATRYAFINDALPPTDWVYALSKFASIICLAIFLTLLPMVIGIIMQLSMGFTHLNLPIYFSSLFGITFPMYVEMIMLAFVLHICINNKFAALGVGIVLWVLFLLARQSGWMDYNLLLYANTPDYGISDLDGIGHMFKPIIWFNIYWLLFGSLLILVGYLFYVRGTISSFKERWQLAKERFVGKAKTIAVALLIAFAATGCYNYYNVSYLNTYYTHTEQTEMAATAEKTLKHFENDPLPSVTAIKMFTDIFPEQQRAVFKSYVTIVNNNSIPIKHLLLDGDNITDYSIKHNGDSLAYTIPLYNIRGKFNFLKARQQPSAYRLYTFPIPLNPGDSMVLEVNSFKEYTAFGNYMYGSDLLRNGALLGDGMPGVGYDDDEEINNKEDREKYGLPKKEDAFTAGNDSAGALIPLQGKIASLVKFDITISTSGDQMAIAPGNLERQWKQDGRNYYHYISNQQGVYTGLGFASARYTTIKDSVQINGKPLGIELYYQPEHTANLQSFVSAYKDGLQYYSNTYGPYAFNQVRLVESSMYNRNTNSAAGLDIYSERFAWNAMLKEPGNWDYCYFVTCQQLAKQWWQGQLSASHTRGAFVIADGLAKYNALLLTEKKFGKAYMWPVIDQTMNTYIWSRGGRNVRNQGPLLTSTRWNETENKAGIVLFGLKNLIGEDSLNVALKEFYTAFAYKSKPPYAGSKDLYAYLKKHTPDSLQYYLADTWEKVTFYDNKVATVTVNALGNNKYKVTMQVDAQKTYQDSDGNDTTANMNDYVDIGIFREGQHAPLYLQKHKLTAGQHTITVTVTGKPSKVGIDPYLTLIDKNINDNVKSF